MKYFWTNNKDKLVLSEEGKLDENLERVKKNGACKLIMSILKFVLVIEIILLFGSTFFIFYKFRSDETKTVNKTQTKINSMNALHDLKFTPENLKDYNNIQDMLSDNKLFDSLPVNQYLKEKQTVNQDSILNTASASLLQDLFNLPQIVNKEEKPKEEVKKNEMIMENNNNLDDILKLFTEQVKPKEELKKNEMIMENNNNLDDILKLFTGQEKPNNEADSSNDTQREIFRFKFIFPLNTEGDENKEIQNSPAELPENDSLHLRILFNLGDPNENQTNENIINPLIIPKSMFDNTESSKENIHDDIMNYFNNFWKQLNPMSNSDNKEIVNLQIPELSHSLFQTNNFTDEDLLNLENQLQEMETNLNKMLNSEEFEKFVSSNNSEKTDSSLFDNFWKNLNFMQGLL